MEQIKQLKQMRDEAFARLQTNPDYKLLTSLDDLIVDLEGVTAIAELAEKSVAEELSKTSGKQDGDKGAKKTADSLDAAFDKLNKDTKPNGNGKVVDLSDEINGGATLS